MAWSEVKQFFLTSDGRTVVYESNHDTMDGDSDGDSDGDDEHYSHFAETYGLSTAELLELLQRYKQACG